MKNIMLQAVRCYGIRPDTLGDYLAGLGVLSAAATQWPDVRGCWRDGAFVLLGKDLGVEKAVESLLGWCPRPYERWWSKDQKADTEAKNDQGIRTARNDERDDGRVELLDAHIISAGGRNQFNPLLGTGGNIGRRDLAKVYEDALQLIKNTKESECREWLWFTLFGNGGALLPELSSAGTWFVFANKTFNSGQGWYRKGQLSPWSFLFALEGARLLSGAASRRLSATARPYAAFPFVSDSAAARASGDVAGRRAEFWAPLWSAPASPLAMRALLARGQARVGAKAAFAAYEFALAARSAGVDAGVTAFQRFSLRQTTSRHTYEAIPEQWITSTNDSHVGELARLSRWMERLPRDGANDKQFFGFRGCMEEALIRLAAEPENPDRWQSILLMLAKSQFEIDRNQNLRNKCLAVPVLSSSLFERAWPSPPPEITVAQAVAAIRSDGIDPMLVQGNIFGVAGDAFPHFPEQRPARAVWNELTPLASMSRIVERRLIDGALAEANPLASRWCCPANVVHAFVDGILDDEQIGHWTPPLSLLGWYDSSGMGRATFPGPADGGGAARLHDLFRPLFVAQARGVNKNGLVAARHLLKLIRQGSWDKAIALARQRFMTDKQIRIIVPPIRIDCDGERVAAAMLIPMSVYEVEENFRKWVLPRKET